MLLFQQFVLATDKQTTISDTNTNPSKDAYKTSQYSSLYFDTIDNVPSPLVKAIQTHLIPKYKLLYLVQGHLNNDKHLDILLALHHEKETSTNKQLVRPALLLINNGKGQYKMVARSDQAISCYACGGRTGDPFDKIIVKPGEFSILHREGGGQYRVKYSATFKYNTIKRNWFLQQIHMSSFKHNTPNKITIKTVKNFGVISFSKHDISRDL